MKEFFVNKRKNKKNKAFNIVNVVFFSLLTAAVICNTYKSNFINENYFSNNTITTNKKGRIDLNETVRRLVYMIQMNHNQITTLKANSLGNAQAIANLQYTPVDKMSANVWVLTENGRGSGSIIKINSKGSYILTAAHVVSSSETIKGERFKKDKTIHIESKSISIVYKDSKNYVAVIEKIDYEYDLALLRIRKKLNVTPIKIAKEEPKIGEVVWAISNPGGSYGIINNGIFSTPKKTHSLVSIGGFFGSSGGMCLNNQGEQIGVISTVMVASMSRFVPSLTIYNGITRTEHLNKFLKGIL